MYPAFSKGSTVTCKFFRAEFTRTPNLPVILPAGIYNRPFRRLPRNRCAGSNDRRRRDARPRRRLFGFVGGPRGRFLAARNRVERRTAVPRRSGADGQRPVSAALPDVLHDGTVLRDFRFPVR